MPRENTVSENPMLSRIGAQILEADEKNVWYGGSRSRKLRRPEGAQFRIDRSVTGELVDFVGELALGHVGESSGLKN